LIYILLLLDIVDASYHINFSLAWWDAFEEGGRLPYGRGRLIEPMYCNNFTIQGIKVINPPFWGIHPYACSNVLIENVVFSAPITSPNTDGIDPDSCSHVVIRNFTASCGDDAIAIKSGKNEYGRNFNMPSYDITIDGGFIGPSSGIDIGSEMSGGVYDVTVQNVHFKGALFATRIKSCRGRGGSVRNITFQDLVLEDMPMGLAITMHYCDGENMGRTDVTTPHFEHISYRRIKGDSLTAGGFVCLRESPCRGLVMEDVMLESKIGGFVCERAFGEAIGTVTPDACFIEMSSDLQGK
jgi:polygalacturonase